MSTDPASAPSWGAPPPEKSTYVPTPDDCTWGMIAHISGLIAYLVGGFTFIGPLIVMLVKKDSPFVFDQAKEALNFQIAVTICFWISVALIMVCVGIALVPIVMLFSLIYAIIAAVEANKGVYYRYPYTIRLIK
jgi:uncharacterized Tic20 family protein